MDTDEGGFTLVEVLVALAISALLMAAAYRGLALGARGMRVSEIDARMIEVARAELARAGMERPLTQGEQSGRYGGIDWILTISPYDAPDGAPGLAKPRAYWTEVEVRAKNRPSRKLTTLKLGEPIDEP